MKCETCGNEYDQGMEIQYRGGTHRFDSFECAIHALAPQCKSCGTRVIGHGAEVGSDIYCSAHCARVSGQTGLIDHSPVAFDLRV
jgi:hypothetical protein